MKSTINYLNPQDFDRVISEIPRLNLKKWSNKDVEMLFKLCYWCCLRVNEAMKLKPDSFNFETHELFLGKTKTEKGATAQIPPDIELEIHEWLKDKKGYLWPGLTRNRVWYWLIKLGKILDLKCFNENVNDSGENTVCHIFRKSMAKDMLYGTHGKKASLNYVMKHLRHTNLQTTTIYLGIASQDLKDWFRSDTTNSDPIMYS